MHHSKKEVINLFIKAYNSFDIDGMLALLHPDVCFKNVSDGKVDAETKGTTEFEKLAKQSASFFSQREQKIISYNEMANKAVLEISYNAVLAADLTDKLKKGDRVVLEGTSEYIFKDDLIISITDVS
jgi:hypothetical protein